MDPLAPFNRNEPCWCGSARKYKRCHGAIRARSLPGEPVAKLTEEDGWVWLAPGTKVRMGALGGGEARLHLPTGTPEARPVRLPDLRSVLARGAAGAESNSDLRSLGRLRVEVLRLIKVRSPIPDSIFEAVAQLTVATLNSLATSLSEPIPPVTIWTEDEDIEEVFRRSLFWADHVLMPDRLFEAILKNDKTGIENAINEQLALEPLVEVGLVVPVAVDVGRAINAKTTVDSTQEVLNNLEFVTWVDNQLILEGPTAVSAALVTARDDLDLWPYFWLHSRSSEPDPEDPPHIRSKILEEYDPNFDYEPWIRQVRNDAISWYTQDTLEQAHLGQLLGGSYIVRSPFRARLLQQAKAPQATATPLVWAELPMTVKAADLRSLARAAKEEEAIEDLRSKMRVALRSVGRPLPDRINAVENLAYELNQAARRLGRTASRERRWQVAVPTAATAATVAVGATTGALIPAVITATLGVISSVAPYISARGNRRSNAAFVFWRLGSRADPKR